MYIFVQSMPAVSIIIPVFNVEAFIRKCLESVRSQTFQDWEAICIDDGSPDACPAILDEYAARDSRFKVIHKENGGASSAKNAGIQIAKGEYCIYLDSDDILHPQTLEICEFMARRDNSDIVAYTYNRVYKTCLRIRHKLHIPDPKRIHFRKYVPSKVPYVLTDNIFDWASEIDYPGVCPNRKMLVKHCQAWRCMYRTSIVKDIRFIDGIIYEDFPWWGEVMLNTHRTTIINLPLYFYYPNSSSLLNSSSQQKLIDSLRIATKASRALFDSRATEEQRRRWEKNFLQPFERIMTKKDKLYNTK